MRRGRAGRDLEAEQEHHGEARRTRARGQGAEAARERIHPVQPADGRTRPRAVRQLSRGMAFLRARAIVLLTTALSRS